MHVRPTWMCGYELSISVQYVTQLRAAKAELLLKVLGGYFVLTHAVVSRLSVCVPGASLRYVMVVLILADAASKSLSTDP